MTSGGIEEAFLGVLDQRLSTVKSEQQPKKNICKRAYSQREKRLARPSPCPLKDPDKKTGQSHSSTSPHPLSHSRSYSYDTGRSQPQRSHSQWLSPTFSSPFHNNPILTGRGSLTSSASSLHSSLSSIFSLSQHDFDSGISSGASDQELSAYSSSELDFLSLLRDDASQQSSPILRRVSEMGLAHHYRKQLAICKSFSPVQEHSQEESLILLTSKLGEAVVSSDDSTPSADDDESKNTTGHLPFTVPECSQVTVLEAEGGVSILSPDCSFGETEITEPGCAACFDAMEALRNLYFELPEKALAFKKNEKGLQRSLREVIVSVHNELEYFFITCTQREKKVKGCQSLKLAVEHLAKALKQAHKKQLAHCPQPLISGVEKKIADSIRLYSKAPDLNWPRLEHSFHFNLLDKLLVPLVNAQLFIHQHFCNDPAGTLFTLRQKCCSSFVRKYFATDHLEHWAMGLLFNCTIDKNLTGRFLAGYFSEDVFSPENKEDACLNILQQQVGRVFTTMENWRDLIKNYHRSQPGETEQETKNFKTLASALSTQSIYARSIEDIKQLDVIAGLMMSWMTPKGRLNLPCWVSDYATRFRFYNLIKNDHPKEALSFKHIPETLLPYVQRLVIPMVFKISWTSGERLADHIRNPSHPYHRKWPVIRPVGNMNAAHITAMPDQTHPHPPSEIAGKHLECIASTRVQLHLPPRALVALAWLYFYQLSANGEQGGASRTIITVVDRLFMLFDLIKETSPTRTLPQGQLITCANAAQQIYPLCEAVAFAQRHPAKLRDHPISIQLERIPDDIDTIEDKAAFTAQLIHELSVVTVSSGSP